MSDTTQNQEPQISEEEAKQMLAEAQATLDKAVTKARQMFTQNIKLADERLKFATEQLASIGETRDKVAEYKDNPEGAFHLRGLDLLVAVYSATKDLMEIEKACNQANLGIIEAEETPEDPKFAIPAENVMYMQARSRIDYNLGVFFWISIVEGIDVVLRATGAPAAITSQSEEEEARRSGAAAALKAAAESDRELGVFLGQVTNELQELLALLEWASSSLSTVTKLAPEAKRTYLEDADWAKLNAKVAFVAELTDRVQAYPALAQHFPQPEPAPLPYEMFTWSEQPAGTGRLSGTGRLGGGGTGTGRLQQGTGRLPRQ